MPITVLTVTNGQIVSTLMALTVVPVKQDSLEMAISAVVCNYFPTYYRLIVSAEVEKIAKAPSLKAHYDVLTACEHICKRAEYVKQNGSIKLICYT